MRDSGTGISQEHLPRLFEPFMTTKPEGLGLGLAIRRSIVHSLEGDIAAFNNSDGGATFEVSLPRPDAYHR